MMGFIIFIFGSVIGSFLNVVICRLETGEDIVKKRSHCPSCGRVLAWYDLVPIASFFALRGRCRACRKQISWQYPLVEAATGLLFVATYIFLFPEFAEGSNILVFYFTWLYPGDIIEVFYYLCIVCSLIVIFVYDLRHYIIPDAVLFPAIGVALAYRLFLAFDFALLRSGNNLFPELVEGFRVLSPYLFSALGVAAFFLLLVLVTRGKGMGLGDVKLALLMGLVLGWPDIFIALFLAFLAGALVGVALILLGRKTLKSQVPFGPFLVGATLAALFFGKVIADGYFNFLM